MSDDVKDVEDQGENVDVKQEDVKEKSIDEIKAEIAAEFAKKEEDYKKKISTLDRVITEKEREKLSETEKAKAELQDALSAKEQAMKEVEDFRRKRVVDSTLYNAGLPAELFEGRVIGQSEDEIKKDITNLKTFIDQLVDKGVETKTKELLKGKSPGMQQEQEGGVISLEEAEKLPDRKQRLEAYKQLGYK